MQKRESQALFNVRSVSAPLKSSSLPQLFEGLKAYPGEDRRLRLFRPMLNMKRMSRSARRVCLPVRPTLQNDRM